MPEPEDITGLLQRTQQGDRVAEARLIEVLYTELRQIAGRCIRSERPELTLQPTALVHEAYMRLAGRQGSEWQNRKHFLATAAQVMRHVLIDCARARRSQKRGGDLCRVELNPQLPAGQDWALDLLDIDEALGNLAKLDERQARIVEMRFFAGLTEAEIAEIIGVSERTVKREWEFARAWLHGQLTRKGSSKSLNTKAAGKG
jgi:RNA polymerase sigma factor (TIGR02999 family)